MVALFTDKRLYRLIKNPKDSSPEFGVELQAKCLALVCLNELNDTTTAAAMWTARRVSTMQVICLRADLPLLGTGIPGFVAVAGFESRSSIHNTTADKQCMLQYCTALYPDSHTHRPHAIKLLHINWLGHN